MESIEAGGNHQFYSNVILDFSILFSLPSILYTDSRGEMEFMDPYDCHIQFDTVEDRDHVPTSPQRQIDTTAALIVKFLQSKNGGNQDYVKSA